MPLLAPYWLACGAAPILARVSGLLPTHTRRSEEMERFQQFSTPAAHGACGAGCPAQITPRDQSSGPSAGTGRFLAILANRGGSLALKRIDRHRAPIFCVFFFQGRPVTTFDAAQIDDHLGRRRSTRASFLMNPPFSAMANVDGRTTEATEAICARRSRALSRWTACCPSPAPFRPDARAWAETFGWLTESAHLCVPRRCVGWRLRQARGPASRPGSRSSTSAGAVSGVA